MESHERELTRFCAEMSRSSSLNNGVQWASQMLLDLAEGKPPEKSDCPACEGSGKFRGEVCHLCDGNCTVAGFIAKERAKRTSESGERDDSRTGEPAAPA